MSVLKISRRLNNETNGLYCFNVQESDHLTRSTNDFQNGICTGCGVFTTFRDGKGTKGKDPRGARVYEQIECKKELYTNDRETQHGLSHIGRCYRSDSQAAKIQGQLYDKRTKEEVGEGNQHCSKDTTPIGNNKDNKESFQRADYSPGDMDKGSRQRTEEVNRARCTECNFKMFAITFCRDCRHPLCRQCEVAHNFRFGGLHKLIFENTWKYGGRFHGSLQCQNITMTTAEMAPEDTLMGKESSSPNDMLNQPAHVYVNDKRDKSTTDKRETISIDNKEPTRVGQRSKHEGRLEDIPGAYFEETIDKGNMSETISKSLVTLTTTSSDITLTYSLKDNEFCLDKGKVPYCDAHKRHKLDMFCVECQTTICSVCKLFNHVGHVYIEYESNDDIGTENEGQALDKIDLEKDMTILKHYCNGVSWQACEQSELKPRSWCFC